MYHHQLSFFELLVVAPRKRVFKKKPKPASKRVVSDAIWQKLANGLKEEKLSTGDIVDRLKELTKER